MIIRSSSLGEIEVNDDSMLYLPDGLLGFEELKQFAFVNVDPFRPFLWLLAADEPELGFAVADPELFFPGVYEVSLSESDKDVLDWQAGDPLAVFVLISIPEGGRRITANLKGPVVLNTRNRLAKQVVVYNPAFSVRQPLIQPSARSMTIAGPPPAQRLTVGQ